MSHKHTELQTRLAAVGRIFDINVIIARPTTTESIKKYYRTNRLAYWFFHSREGFMHVGLSSNNVYSEKDLEAPAQLISSYIKKNKATQVLELAVGKGANMRFLTARHPAVSFYGLDLPNGQLKAHRFADTSNAKVEYGDYHDLSRYTSKSMDIVFVVESLCYSQDKSRVLHEVKRVLKPGGMFIVFDGYNARAISEYSDQELIAVTLMWKGMIGEIRDFDISEAEPLFKKSGFKILKAEDLSEQTLPTARRMEKIAAKFFRHPKLARIVIKLLPMAFSANAISGYLMPYTLEHKLVQYKLIIATTK